MRHVLSPFEIRLLRKGVQRLTAGREDCVDCQRTPLIGEEVYVYDGGAIVCALCREAHQGEPESSRLVLHSELGQTVKPAAPVAA